MGTPRRRRRHPQLRRTGSGAALGVVSFLIVMRAAAGTSPLVLDEDRHDAIEAVRTPCPWVAVTFDDGPDPSLTPRALEILAAHDTRATFYVVGSAVEAHPEVVARTAAAGHELAHHTWSHRDLVDRDPAAVVDELHRTEAAIERSLRSSGGLSDVRASRHLRPPRGRIDDAAATAVDDAGWQLVGWNASPDRLSRRGAAPQEAARRVVEPMGPGAIVLLHDGGPAGRRSLAALGPLLEAIEARGLRAVSVRDLLVSAVTGRCATSTTARGVEAP